MPRKSHEDATWPKEEAILACKAALRTPSPASFLILAAQMWHQAKGRFHEAAVRAAYENVTEQEELSMHSINSVDSLFFTQGE